MALDGFHIFMILVYFNLIETSIIFRCERNSNSWINNSGDFVNESTCHNREKSKDIQARWNTERFFDAHSKILPVNIFGSYLVVIFGSRY